MGRKRKNNNDNNYQSSIDDDKQRLSIEQKGRYKNDDSIIVGAGFRGTHAHKRARVLSYQVIWYSRSPESLQTRPSDESFCCNWAVSIQILVGISPDHYHKSLNVIRSNELGISQVNAPS
ncbi:6405_t:CDS:2, partial [Funneliformis mosseae]